MSAHCMFDYVQPEPPCFWCPVKLCRQLFHINKLQNRTFEPRCSQKPCFFISDVKGSAWRNSILMHSYRRFDVT